MKRSQIIQYFRSDPLQHTLGTFITAYISSWEFTEKNYM